MSPSKTTSGYRFRFEDIYGWIIVVVAFFCICIPDGILVAFGGFVNPLAKEFQVNPTTISLAASIMNGVKSLFGLVVSTLMDKYGYRIIGITGGLILAGSLLVCAFSSHVLMLVIFFGVFGGIGGAMVFLPPIILIGQYFKKRRALATTIARVGSPLGGFILVPLCNILQDLYGWRKAFLGLVGISLICPVLCGLLKMANHLDLEPVPNLARRKSFYIGVPLKSLSANSSEACSRDPRSMEMSIWRHELAPVASTDKTSSSEPATNAEDQCQRETSFKAEVEESQSNPVDTYSLSSSCNTPGTELKIRPKIVIVPPFEETMLSAHIGFEQSTDDQGSNRSRVSLEGSSLSDPSSSPFYNVNQILLAHLEMLAKRKPTRWDRFCMAFSLDLFRNPVFSFFCLANALGNASGFIPFVYLQGYMSEIDISNTLCGMVIALMQLSNALGRLPLGVVADLPTVSPILITMLLWILSGITVTMFTLLNRVELFVICGILYGLGNTALSIQSVVLLDILEEMNRLPDAFGLLLFLEGVTKTILPPLSGYCASFFSCPELVFYWSAVGFALSASSCFTAHVLAKQEKNEPGGRVTFV
ncbi:hypothetical protein TCAL_10737 [Tigriopus californicus]|uniref:Major facilitator superfamily (MFS) profile domain-containing protein n=2 Tax=Tigriopus californicus TaxID=6832 RepID=A0A553NV80_TIGCA|nr:hypothetical protein TCAL_10737 [Tigriopus californicus]